MFYRLSRLLVRALALLAVLSAGPAAAAPISYHVTIDTSSIAGTNGSLEFQVSTFSQSPPGAAFISAWNGDAGILIGGPIVANVDPTDPTSPLLGSVSGTLPTGMSIFEAPPFSADVFQDFTFGNSLGFIVQLPEEGTTFNLTLWNSSAAEVLAGNGSPLLGNPDVNGAPFALQLTSGIDGGPDTVITGSAAVTAQVIPEPGSLGLFALAVAGLAVRHWRRRRAG